jgi:NAD(P)-dependent dehydrogenase (short-subunit alcohol dehydrogenase family)
VAARRDFTGKTVVITGAAGGLGSAFARRFGKAGAKLGLLDVSADGLQTISRELETNGVENAAFACDITRAEECRDAIAGVIQRFGAIDALINNAGITHRSAFRETDVAVFRRVMNINYFGSLYCTKAALESLIERKGLIVVISSVAGFSPLLGRSGYAASKHALHGLFDSLRTELKHMGVDVTIVCPGFTATGIATKALGGDGQITTHPQSTFGRISKPDEVAEAVFQAACRGGRRLVVLSAVGRLTRIVHKISPGLYERLMARSLASELKR